MGETVEAFIRLQDRDMLYRYILAVDKLVGAHIWLFDDNYELWRPLITKMYKRPEKMLQ